MWPVLFRIGNFGIRTYGVVLVGAFFVCLWLAKIEARRVNLSKKTIDHLANYLLLGGLLGARVYYALFYDPYYYFTKPWTLLFIWEGGLAIHGAIIGGILALYIFSRKWQINFFSLADLLAPIVLLGQAIGRLGCFLNGCCYGYPTTKPWGVIFPQDSFAYYQFGYQALHPTQLYELGLDLLGFVFLWLSRRKVAFRGQLFSLYLISYGLIRFVVSFFRADSLYLWGTSLKMAHLLSIALVLAGVIIFKKRKSDLNSSA